MNFISFSMSGQTLVTAEDQELLNKFARFYQQQTQMKVCEKF